MKHGHVTRYTGVLSFTRPMTRSCLHPCWSQAAGFLDSCVEHGLEHGRVYEDTGVHAFTWACSVLSTVFFNFFGFQSLNSSELLPETCKVMKFVSFSQDMRDHELITCFSSFSH